MILSKLLKSITFRLASNQWRRYAIENAFEGYHGTWVKLKEINLVVRENEFEFLLKGYNLAKNLRNRKDAEFEIKNNTLRLYVDNIVLAINSEEELFIANEIFVNQCYDFYVPNESVVIDIGMNVGMASLFFSAKKDVSLVFGFEPFKPTFRFAQLNLGLNPNLSRKIRPFNVGLGHKTRDLKVDYSGENKGQVGVFGTSLIKSVVKDTQEEIVKIESAKLWFEKILEECNHLEVIVKMDCEGAEFEIIPFLKSSRLLRKINLLLIEWHSNPNDLIDMIKSENFRIVRTNQSGHTGMIYAARN